MRLLDWSIRANDQRHTDRVIFMRSIFYEIPARWEHERQAFQQDRALSLNISSGGILLLVDIALDIQQILNYSSPLYCTPHKPRHWVKYGGPVPCLSILPTDSSLSAWSCSLKNTAPSFSCPSIRSQYCSPITSGKWIRLRIVRDDACLAVHLHIENFGHIFLSPVLLAAKGPKVFNVVRRGTDATMVQ